MDIVNKHKSNTQWYSSNPELYHAEIEAMSKFFPDASHGFLDTGQMFWRASCYPVISKEKKEWILMLVYNSDHPNRNSGCSIRCYPISPDYSELKRRVLESNVIPKIVPHCLHDNNGVWLSTELLIDHDIHNTTRIKSAASVLKDVLRWITLFELGIQDQSMWDKFAGP